MTARGKKQPVTGIQKVVPSNDPLDEDQHILRLMEKEGIWHCMHLIMVTTVVGKLPFAVVCLVVDVNV